LHALEFWPLLPNLIWKKLKPHMPSACFLRSLVALVTFAFVLSGTAVAQTQEDMGVTIAVTDSSGGVVEGAIVVFYMGTTERRGTTGVDGNARFADVAPGQWTAEVRKEGFAVTEQPVSVATTPLTVDVTLALPAIQETVTVETRLGALDTTATSATRLELSLRELPATLNVVTQAAMQERGANTAMDAIEVAGGTLSGAGSGIAHNCRGIRLVVFLGIRS
jgi:iron complex outermembrane receptor protein